MSDNYETLAFDGVDEERASAAAAAAIGWLVERGIVLAQLKDCVLGNGGLGHPPGARWMEAIASPTDWPAPDYWTNGVSAFSAKTIVHPGECAQGPVRCPRCGAAQGDDDRAPDAFLDAVGDWWAGGIGAFECSRCGEAPPVTLWECEPHWAFGCAGLTFWNWPPLDEAFVQALGQHVGSPRVRCVVGRL